MTIYRAFGLTIESVLALPELLEDTGAAQVTVTYGDVPLELEDAAHKGVRFQSAPGFLHLRVDGVARFLIKDGESITIDRDPDASDDDVRLFLLGSAMGAILQQRGALALHGSAIDVDGRAVVFLGQSGVGKSTLASAFRLRGFAVLTDDICAVFLDEDGTPIVMPGYPQAKLWKDSLERLKIEAGPLRCVRPQIEKRAVPFQDRFCVEPRPLERIYILGTSNRDELSITPISGPDKFSMLREFSYRQQYVGGQGTHTSHFKQSTALAQRIPISQVVRPREGFLLDELVDLLSAEFCS